jgi:hypothetical protein
MTSVTGSQTIACSRRLPESSRLIEQAAQPGKTDELVNFGLRIGIVAKMDLPGQHGSGLGLSKRLRIYLRSMLGPISYPQPFANGGCLSGEAGPP